ncbi:TonB-dependent siderophore receptor [Vandammella animalimorsus]|uniref:TonB-dependent siderophore receptor n=1 Tax=Vandammella animalimorsus TaxID=2029117 RepID=A0A3M6R7M8_9BURK|nr:TonB-dependent siderophore receptor [Vandammella animalimorsus]
MTAQLVSRPWQRRVFSSLSSSPAGPPGWAHGALAAAALACLAVASPGRAAQPAAQPGQPVAAELPTVTVRGDALGEAAADEGRSGKLARRAQGATKTDTPLLHVPQSVSVITETALRDSGATSLDQALAYLPGLYAPVSGGNDSSRYDFVSLRGQSYNGAMFFDGMRASFGIGNLSLPQFDPWLIERVEVLRGPASALYGQGLPGGLVNLRAKRPGSQDSQSGQAQRVAGLTLGSHGQRALRLDAGGPAAQGALDWRLAALAREAGNQIAHVREQRVALAPSLRWRIAPGTALTLLASHQRDPRGGYYHSALPMQGTLTPLPGGGYIPRRFFVGEPAFDRFARRQSTAGYDFEHALGQSWQLRHALRAIDAQAEVQALSAIALAPPATLMRSGMAVHSRTRALLSDTTLQGRVQTGAAQHRLLLGLDAMRSRTRQRLGMNLQGLPPIDIWQPAYGQAIAVPDGPGSAMLWADTRDRASQIGLYAQDQIDWGRWSLTLGGRYDIARSRSARQGRLMGALPTDAASRQRDRAFSGRAALGYRLGDALAAYLSHGSAFLPQTGLDARGQGYRPLTARQWEAGLKYAPPQGGLQLAAAVFQIQQKNALTPDPEPSHLCPGLAGPGACMVQTGRQRTRGLELEAKAELGRASFVHASLTLLDARITASNGPEQGQRPVNIPARTASLWLDHALSPQWPQWRMSLGLRHTGSTRADPANTVRVPGHTLMDAALRYRFGNSGNGGSHGSASGERPSLTLRASNLADRRYVACASASYCNWGRGRSVSVELHYPW